MIINKLKAPFPYFGGKSRAADIVWASFGDIKNYVEPFAGSVAMLLAAPDGKRTETINDFDGMVANFWRSIVYKHEETAHYADWPCNENDLFARHLWLVEQLKLDPEYSDPKNCRVLGMGSL